MNTEKLEKLKKSLDNKFIPDNMKDKIRAEIKKLEADIKTDETITATEVKEEVKEIEKKVEEALEVAEEKKAKAPAKRTTRKPATRKPATRKPATRKPATSRTKTPKVEPKPKSTKKSVFSIAKEIRKDNESWEDAKQRARKTMKSETTETKKKVRTETSKLLASIRRKKELKGLTSNVKRDINRTALPKGKRISENGKVYYEYRDDHSDRLAPSYKDKIYLAEGGGVDTVYDVDVNYKQINGYVGRFPMNQKTIDRLEEAFYFMYFDLYDTTNKKPMSYIEVSEILFDSMKEKGLYEQGGGVGKLSFDEWMKKNNIEVYKRTYYWVADDGKGDYLYSGKKTEVMQSLKEDYKKDKYADGGTIIGTPETPLARGLDIDYTGLVGETGGMSAGELFANGGRTNERRHVNKSEDYEVRYAKPRPNRTGYKGVRNFGNGGGIEDNAPQIYVADLEAYNNGKLVGKWFNLLDYNDADELMEDIQEMLKESGGGEYAVHDIENLPRSMYSEYMGFKDFEEIYQMIDLAKDKDLPLEVVMEVVNDYTESAVDEYNGVYDSEEDFAEQLIDDIGIQSFNNFEYYLEISDTDRRLMAQEMADSYVDDIRDEDGGNRLIEEAGLDVDEYEEADSDRQEEMLDEAREIVYDEYYNTWYDGLDDPYNFLVEEQGLYGAEDFANASFVRVDTEKLARDLEQDYTFVRHDGQVYVFNIR